MRIAVLVSGGGTNLQAIIDCINNKELSDVEIARVVSSRANTYAQTRAERFNIPASVVIRKNYQSQRDYDLALISVLENDAVELIVLAGFLSFLGSDFINKYKNRIINVHPSLVPSFCGEGMYGIRPHEAAIKKGVKISGATVHFVDEEYDTGPIILQKAVIVEDDDTPEILQKRIMIEAEQVILPMAIKLFSKGAIIIEERRTKIKIENDFI